MRVLIFFIAILGIIALPALPSSAQTIPAPVYLPMIHSAPAAPTATATATRAPVLPTATATRLPATATPVPTATTALLYICTSDAYNCTDFGTQAEAQAVLDYCAARGAGDIHKLDQDDDGVACESLPLRLW